jgi:hypothetical protein
VKKTIIFLSLAIIWGLLLFACSAGDKGPMGPNTATAVFQNGVLPSAAYVGCTDATIENEYPTINVGSCDYLISGGYASVFIYRIVIKFDLSYIVPSNVHVTSAKLTLYTDSLNDISSLSNTHTAYALTKAWTGGTGSCGGSANVNTSWNFANGSSDAWSNPGADGNFNATAASNSVPVHTVGVGTEIEFNLDPSVVQAWLSNTDTNYGLIIKAGTESSPAGLGYWLRPCSSNIAATAYRPKLTINYTLP